MKDRESRPTSLDALVDHISAPVLLVDRTGVLRHTNFAGTLALQRGQHLELRNGRVRPRNAKQKRQFLSMLSAALSNDPTTMAWHQSFTMRLFGVEGQVVVLIAQTLHGQVNLGGLPQADAVLFLIRPAENAQINTVRLRIIFGFTPAETRLAECLIHGMNLVQISEQLHLSRETLKTQLRSLFNKTKTHRQGELIALLLSVISVSIA